MVVDPAALMFIAAGDALATIIVSLPSHGPVNTLILRKCYGYRDLTKA